MSKTSLPRIRDALEELDESLQGIRESSERQDWIPATGHAARALALVAEIHDLLWDMVTVRGVKRT